MGILLCLNGLANQQSARSRRSQKPMHSTPEHWHFWIRFGLRMNTQRESIRGYGFFAPAVPNSSKLVFEITYADGHREYELPVVSGNAAGLRLCTLLSQLPRMHYESARELVMRMVAYSVWQRHPTAKRIRAVVGFIRVPPPGAARDVDIADYQFQYAYDFTFDTD